jgi:hypothetical protein
VIIKGIEQGEKKSGLKVVSLQAKNAEIFKKNLCRPHPGRELNQSEKAISII